MAIKVRRAAYSLHNWVGLIIGVQFLFWTVGGMVMTVLPLDLVRGSLSRAETQPVTFTTVQWQQLAQTVGEGARSVSATSLAGEPVAEVIRGDGSKVIYQFSPFRELADVSEGLARRVAEADYFWRGAEPGSEEGRAKAVSATLLTEEPGDFRRDLPVWQVHLNDPDGTIIYVSPKSGKVLARRNDIWRFYDFFWMLHILDFEDRSDTNNWLVIIASITASLFMITGFILLYYRFWPWRRRNAGAAK
jgi:uncharacterized iron-regulated membrane protein